MDAGDFDLAITDMYLKGKMNDEHCETLREIVMDLDASIPKGLIYPRLNELTKIILNINRLSENFKNN